MERFFNLETVGISPSELTTALPIPHYDGSRIISSLPWKNDERPSSNMNSAMARLNKMTERLSPEQKQQYSEYIQDMLSKDYIAVCDKSPSSYYLPHHGVWKRDKLRVVFDGSAKAINGSPSINEMLHTGPNLLPRLILVASEFRKRKYVARSDIKAAFLQIQIAPSDQLYLQFIWDKTVYCFQRLPFGLNCSPWILNNCLRHYFSIMGFKNPHFANQLRKGIYVDDIVPSFSSQLEATTFISFATALFKDAGMDLKDWETNWNPSSLEPQKVLGIPYYPENDFIGTDFQIFYKLVN